MVFNEVFRVALRALARNKMRTILTTLGIIIGVGAVICIVGLGQGAGQAVQAQIQGDQLRVSGKKKDDLQAVIALLKGRDFGVALQFTNYR